MVFGQQKIDNLSVEELERVLKIKQREARKERFLRLSATGATRSAALLSTEPITPAAKEKPARPKKPKTLADRLLTLVEVAAVIGLLVILGVSYNNLRSLNREMAAAQTALVAESPAPVAAAPIQQPSATDPLPFDRLPGGHTSPTSAGGAVPDIPAHLQNWVQPRSTIAPVIEAPEQQAAPGTRIVIPKINVDAPIIEGVTWEDLKKGVGHLPGSANPGERGNLYLAAHNDIFGEIFRYLEKLEPGDRYYIYAGDTKYTYEVREKRIINPTDVEVMLPTTGPVSTLQTCYPYLIDTHRLVVIADLVE